MKKFAVNTSKIKSKQTKTPKAGKNRKIKIKKLNKTLKRKQTKGNFS